jgi:ABC-2 type transport system permease protein
MSIKNIIALFYLELFKMFRLKLTYFLLGFIVLSSFLWGMAADLFFTDKSDASNGFIFFITSAQSIMSLIGTIFILIYCSLLISSETASGTLHLNLVNPILRSELLLAKMMGGWVFSLLITFCIGITSFIIGSVKFGYKDIQEGMIIHTKSQIFLLIINNLLILSFVLLAFVNYSLLISILTSNSGQAIAFSVGGILLLDIIKYRIKISPYLFQTYIEKPFDLIKDNLENFGISGKSDVIQCFVVSLIWASLCFFISLLILNKKDLKV